MLPPKEKRVYYTETEAKSIKKRNEELLHGKAKQRLDARHRVEDILLAKELGLSVDEVTSVD